jgi:serine/threonine protein kinase/beta-lactam-binding protein with PASTA domain
MSSITEQVGRVVGGRYRLLAPIGAGASSQVFAAVDTRLGRRVAVKVLHPALESDGTFLGLFRAEARFAASLDHPHVMRVFDWGEEQAGPYLVLELLTGGSLRALLDKSGRLDHAQTAAIGRQAAAGLSYAHRQGIIHRDIKPGNILFDDDGHLRIGDFGVARAMAGAAATEPLGSMFGTARYSSPEQATGASLDARTDVYSLALVLYEALTGKVPFSADTVANTLSARVGASLPPAPELGPLAPILAAAAIPEPLARLEAADLAGELETLGRALPTPRPLPLARLELGPQLEAIADRDPTDLDPGHPSVTATGKDPAEATEVVAVPPVVPPPSRPAGQAGEKSPLKKLLAFGGALLGAALVALGLVAAIVHFEVYGHVVPDVVGEPLATAQAVLANDDLGMKAEMRFSETVPKNEVISQGVAKGTREKANFVVPLVVSKGPAPVKVPGVVGLFLGAAEGRLHAVGLVPLVAKKYSETVPAGRVISQAPLPSAGLRLPGSKVVLEVSLGPHPRHVPPVLGESLATAEQALKAVQLGYRVGPGRYSTKYAQGEVMAESPPGGHSVPRGYTVTLVVSLGKPYVTLPRLAGDSLGKAESTLRSLGLTWQVYGPSIFTQVLVTEPGAGSRLREGSPVDLYVGP